MINKYKIVSGVKGAAAFIAFMVVVVVLTMIISPLFGFLPEKWGYYNEDDDFVKYSEAIPAWVSITIVGGAIYAYYAFKDVKRRSLEKDIVLSVLNVNNDLYAMIEKNDIKELYIYNPKNNKLIIDISLIRILDQAKMNTAKYLEKNDMEKKMIDSEYVGKMHYGWGTT